MIDMRKEFLSRYEEIESPEESMLSVTIFNAYCSGIIDASAILDDDTEAASYYERIAEQKDSDNALLKKDAGAYKLYISEQEADNKVLTAKVEILYFAVSTRDVKIRSLESDNALLTKALTDIDSINWGADGDCGAQRIINEVLD